MDKELIVLTKENCGECKKLKMFVDKALKDEQKDKIGFIQLEKNEELFNKLAEEYSVRSLPVMIKDGKAYNYTTNGIVKKLLA